MKSKKQIWILGPVVLLIWGIIGYRIFKTVGGDNDIRVSSPIPAPLSVANADTTTYKLSLDYDDPFLKRKRRVVAATRPSSSKPAGSNAKAKKVVRKIEKPPVKWPDIHYRGLIRKNNDSRVLYLVEVAGSSLFFQTGNEIQELKLLKAYPDSIMLQYKEEEKRTFVKEQ